MTTKPAGKLRIAMVVAHLPTRNNGGTERQAARGARELAQRGHDVWLFVRGQAARAYRSDGLWIVERPELRSSSRAYARIPALRLFWDIAHGIGGIVRSGLPFDVVLAYHTLDAGFLGTAAALATRTPHVLWVRSQVEYRGDPRPRGRELAPLVWLLSHLILVQTPTMAASFASTVRSRVPPPVAARILRKVRIMPNGLDLPAEVSAPSTERQLLFVGRLERGKGLDDLIEALPSIPSARLTVVGDGVDRARLEALASGRPVCFLGWKSHAELAEQYRCASVVVLPSSLVEGLPNVVLEAMAFGRPVVATRNGGILDVVQDGVNGALVEPGSPTQLSAAICWLLADNDRLRTLGLAARHTATAYAWETVVPLLEAALKAARDAAGPLVASLPEADRG